ncbi:hypothetical protein A2392_01365 [Candidatus Kaiserbacteria bacterium RIFOXYB1_FULL_46_14]|uniref:Uncharacterized protein n=1 Tax=Candidatus Kaiserbacteria bacterium RIFOXYB1_FULL_46_14 TaxID=1798531 RepID=A0A1F6FJQ4_9BACT|nr:MAG: hypothetical protein A2392_01365 [Candidatus Kaiserbacteria bacterium RIFOXYB1_FULL_46_14]
MTRKGDLEMKQFVIVHTSVLTKSLVVVRAGTAVDANLRFEPVADKCPFEYALAEVKIAIRVQERFISSYGDTVIAIYDQQSVLRAYNMAAEKFGAMHLEVFQIMATSDHLGLQRIEIKDLPAPKVQVVPYRPADTGSLAMARKAAISAK